MTDAALHMDRMYAWQTRIYDATRRYYLLGRDELIASLAPPPAGRVLEIGCGTGRNLVRAARVWPNASYFGIDVSDVMLTKARSEIDRAGLPSRVRLGQGDAVSFDPEETLRLATFDRIYFSYTLSMIPEWEKALEHAAGMLAPGGVLSIADFGDQRDLPPAFRRLLRKWLATFSVDPREDLAAVLRGLAMRRGLSFEFRRLFRSYAFLASLRRPA